MPLTTTTSGSMPAGGWKVRVSACDASPAAAPIGPGRASTARPTGGSMAAESARLRRLGVRRADHQHDRGPNGHISGKVRPFHRRNGDAPGGASDDPAMSRGSRFSSCPNRVHVRVGHMAAPKHGRRPVGPPADRC